MHTKKLKIQLSVVIPCYNEEETLDKLFTRLNTVCLQLNVAYELIFVSDGSSDQTWSIITRLAAQTNGVVGIKLARNHGHQLALSAGLSIAKGERIFILDADLQDPPELLPEMIKLMDEGADVVYGKRQSRTGETWFKLSTAAIFYRTIDWLSDTRIPRDTGDFRLISRKILDRLLAMPEQHRFIRGMVSWTGGVQVPFLYERASRQAGISKYPFRKMLSFAIDAITGFSIKPLRIATALGLLMSLGGAVIFAYVITSWALNHTVVGWTSLMAATSLIGGIQLLVLGIMGEYLGRLYIEVKRRPLFFIDTIIDHGTESTD